MLRTRKITVLRLLGQTGERQRERNTTRTNNRRVNNDRTVYDDLVNNLNEDTDYSTVSNRTGNTNMDDATVNEIFEDFDRTVCARTTLQPLDISFISNRSMNKCKETSLTLLMQPKISVKLKNYVDCMLIRMIANKINAKNDSFVRTYNRQGGNQKVTKSQPYTRLYSVMMFEKEQPTNKIAYIIEDNMNHNNLWDFNTNIRDNGGITVGTVIRLHHVKPIERMMADDCASIVTAKPAVVMKNPMKLNEVNINYQVTAGIPCTFVLNSCILEILDSEPIETGCGGLFCDKQRISEITNYGQGCCCFCFSQKRANMEIFHTMVIKHISLEEPIYVQEYSSTRFSLLFQTSVLNSEITKASMDMTDNFFDLQEAIENVVDYINKNGGKVVGWYKRGKVQYHTVLVQNSNDPNNTKFGNSANQKNAQVDNSEINFHPCIVRSTNEKFTDEKSDEFKEMKSKKFDVNVLMGSA